MSKKKNTIRGLARFCLSMGVLLAVLLWTIPTVAAQPAAPVGETPSDTGTGNTLILTIPAAAFTPFEDGYDYENHGRYLKHLHSAGGGTERGWYYAPVQLPHGAEVTKFTFYWYDGLMLEDGVAKLQRAWFYSDNFEDMAEATSSLYPGYGSSVDTTISNANISLGNYSYWVVWDLPASAGVMGCSVVIEYNPLPQDAGILLIPAAAFTPFEDGYHYQNAGRHLRAYYGTSGDYHWYVAPVQLPQGARVGEFHFFWYDANEFFNGTAVLQRTDLDQGNYDDMARAETYGAVGYSDTPDASIDFAIIDNRRYAYWVIWELPEASVTTSVQGLHVTISYLPPATQSNMLSISAAAFKSFKEGYDFQNHGRYLMHFHGLGETLTNGSYYAQVHLLQGKKVVRVTYHYYNSRQTGSGGGVYLQRTQLGVGDYQNMSEISISSAQLGYRFASDESINYAEVDNTQYAYWLVLDLPPSLEGEDQQIWGCDVVIEYEYKIHLPLAKRN